MFLLFSSLGEDEAIVKASGDEKSNSSESSNDKLTPTNKLPGSFKRGVGINNVCLSV